MRGKSTGGAGKSSAKVLRLTGQTWGTAKANVATAGGLEVCESRSEGAWWVGLVCVFTGVFRVGGRHDPMWSRIRPL